jgi:hypothetical protein
LRSSKSFGPENITNMSIDSIQSIKQSVNDEFYKLKKSLYRALLNREMKETEFLDTSYSNVEETTRQSLKSRSLISQRNKTASAGLRIRKPPMPN